MISHFVRMVSYSASPNETTYNCTPDMLYEKRDVVMRDADDLDGWARQFRERLASQLIRRAAQ